MSTGPNLLFIHTDQQHFQAMSALGNPYVHTPNMDRLAARGTVFTNTSCAVPVCCPSRASWYTGRPASEHGIVANRFHIVPDMPDLGQWFSTRGYLPVYTGKWHVGGRDAYQSFLGITANCSNLGEQCDPAVSRSAQAFLANYDGDKPFFLSVGLLQPHDCCYWRISRPEDITELPFPCIADDLPPVPETLRMTFEEPPTMSHQLERVRNRETPLWSDLQWRYYIWAYYRQVEMADAEVGRVLDALEHSAFADDTVIVFTSDHGDGLGHHNTASKFFLYDEAVRVPLIVSLPGQNERRDVSDLISGMDIAPTLCDFAGIDAMLKCRGRSFRPQAEGRSGSPAEFVVSESNITGRMIRTSDYKLITYKGETPEMLFDMRDDPLEIHNLGGETSLSSVLADLKRLLADWESRLEPAVLVDPMAAG